MATGAPGSPRHDAVSSVDPPGGTAKEPSSDHRALDRLDGVPRRKLGSRTRGVETVFRTSYRVHMDLTAIADNKANIMITVNGLILSILLASAASRSGDDRSVLLPISIALIGSMAAIVFAVLAAKPRLLTESLSGPDDVSDRTNLLFFGNYTGLSEDEFVDSLSDLVTDTNRMYRTMMRDVYDMGTVLDQKFRYLHRSYSAFVAGIVLSVGTLVTLFALGA